MYSVSDGALKCVHTHHFQLIDLGFAVSVLGLCNFRHQRLFDVIFTVLYDKTKV
jgi:hypothetical protein